MECVWFMSENEVCSIGVDIVIVGTNVSNIHSEFCNSNHNP